MIDNLEKLLLLKINVSRLESTGMTRILESTQYWHKNLENIMRSFSPIERIMRVILIDVEDRLNNQYGIENRPFLSVVPQYKVGNYRVDFLVELWGQNNNKYVIECDGYNFHEKTKEQIKYEKQRERFLVEEGYKVLRFSGSEIYSNFEKITQELVDIFEKEYEGVENE